MAKIDIVSGFLGAGKTTLIKKLLGEVFHNEQVVLIENEFGEIGIDGGFLKEAGVEITEMNSGCICCSLVGDFGKALNNVIEKFHPDRILIEPSGVGKLSDVIKAVEDTRKITQEIELDSFVTVVDATKCKMYIKNFGEFFNNQIESANTIILSRTANMTGDKLETIVNLLKEHNEKATMITTPWEELTGEQILAAMNHSKSLMDQLLEEAKQLHEHKHHHKEHECDHEHEEHSHREHKCDHEEHHHHEHHQEGHHHQYDENNVCSCGHHHDQEHHHADDIFTSLGMETVHKFVKEELETVLGQLSKGETYGMILRAKGIVPGVDGTWYHFDLVPEEYEIRVGSADYTGRICVIGTDLKEKEIKGLFHILNDK